MKERPATYSPTGPNEDSLGNPALNVPQSRVPLQRVVLITRLTRLEELILRHNTRDQVRFYLRHLGEDYAEYEAEHEQYQGAVAAIRRALTRRLGSTLGRSIRVQMLERALLPTYQFAPTDLGITVGPKGMVANAAKYLAGQPLLALEPYAPASGYPVKTLLDSIRMNLCDSGLERLIASALARTWEPRRFTMAQAQLGDGQRLLALNDLFIGQSGHAAANYQLNWAGQSERQCSSGIIVATGTGSTGWLSSMARGAAGLQCQLPGLDTAESKTGARRGRQLSDMGKAVQFSPEAPYLVWGVREPFVDAQTGATLLGGIVGPATAEPGDAQALPREMEVVSHMPQRGVIFSDGMEADFLEFPAGARARISVAPEKLHALTLN